jgi:small redox-active disulfide protein 1
MVVIKVLTSPSCPYCPLATEVVRKFVKEKKDVVALELSVTTDEGMKEALKFGIRSVPAIIIDDTYVMVGVPTMGELKSAVEMVENKNRDAKI